MKFKKFVKSIFKDFNAAKEQNSVENILADLNNRIEGFKSKFNPELDGFSFDLIFEITQPRKGLVQELQDTGRHSLITDNPFDHAEQERIKNEYQLRFTIDMRAQIEDLTFEMDEDFNYKNEKKTKSRRVGSVKYNEEGYRGGNQVPRYAAWNKLGNKFIQFYMNTKM